MLQLVEHGQAVGRRLAVAGSHQHHLGKVDGQCQFAGSLRSAKHDGMWQTVLVDHLHQALLHLVLSYYLFKHF